MFKTTAGIAALACFTQEAMATRLGSKFRPPQGAVPWKEDSENPQWTQPKYPTDYTVQNLGIDSEIQTNFNNLVQAEDQHKHKLSATFKKPSPPNRDYVVPHYGEDNDILTTKQHLAESEISHKHTMEASFKAPDQHPRDYFVPDFGEDHDIRTAKLNINNAEKKLNHVINTEAPPKPQPRDYFVPHFGEDQDIVTAKSNINLAEKQLGHSWQPQRDGNGGWEVPTETASLYANYKKEQGLAIENLVQVESDPICSSAGCTQYNHKPVTLGYDIDYYVPNFGEDRDITDSKNDLDLAQKQYGWIWKFGTGESKKKQRNPAKDTLYDFQPRLDDDMISSKKNLDDAETNLKHQWVIEDVQLNSDLKTESDPICSSAGCTQYKQKRSQLGYPIDYEVPDFGKDSEMKANMRSLAIAEKMYKHKLVMGTKASKAQWHNDAKDTEYNFEPRLDRDIIVSKKNLDDSEKRLKHKWVIDDLQTDEQINTGSDPICSSAGCTQYKQKRTALGYPVDYPVPNFGVDHDIIDSRNSLANTEGFMMHKLDQPSWKKKHHNEAKDTMYNFAPRLDADIITTKTNLDDAQTRLKHKWVIEDMQTEADLQTRHHHHHHHQPRQVMAQSESDPICGSGGCSQYKHKKTALGYPVDYPVPNFGRDTDIIDSQFNLRNTEAYMNHNLGFGSTKFKAKHHNVAKDTLYNFSPHVDADIRTTAKNLMDTEKVLNHHWVIEDVQLDADVDTNTVSDPICSSAGCTQYKHEKQKLGYDIDYPVANFGEDHDIKDLKHNLAIVERDLKHKLVMGTKQSKKKWHNDAKDTEYDFQPKFDEDIRSSLKNLQDTEKKQNHKWVIEE